MTLSAYVTAVLSAYVALPDTPSRHRSHDRRVAADWFRQDVPLEQVRAALLLATLRRRCHSPLSPTLAPIRSIAYFQPVLDEIRRMQPPLDPAYVAHLLVKLQPAPVQIPAVSRER